LSTYESGFWRGLGGGGGPFWLQRETLTFMGPAAYQNSVVFRIGMKQNSSKLQHTVCKSLEVIRL